MIHSHRFGIIVMESMIVLAMKLADALAPVLALAFAFVAGVWLVNFKTPSILLLSSSNVFITPVTISIGAPFFPMKNNDGNGTNLSAAEKKNQNFHKLMAQRKWKIAFPPKLETLHI